MGRGSARIVVAAAVASVPFAILTLGGSCYCLLVVFAAIRFRRELRAPNDPKALPPISVLKPAGGAEPSLFENIESHLAQDYPDWELLVGVEESAHDLAVELSRRFPGVKVVSCEAPNSGNRKVAILEQLVQQARHDLLVVNDADIRVQPQYLRRVAGALGPGVGLATCLYRAKPGPTLASRIDAFWISAEFAGQALAARATQGLRFGLGATLAFRRADLERIGGFAAIRDFLADDYQLGARIAELGKQVVLAPEVVETAACELRWRDVWSRHLRWSRTIRLSRPLGHAGLILTQPVVWSLALLATGELATWTLAVGALGLACRLAAAWATGRATGSDFVLRQLWLAPLVDLWSFAAWACSFTSRRVVWRGREIELDSSGRI